MKKTETFRASLKADYFIKAFAFEEFKYQAKVPKFKYKIRLDTELVQIQRKNTIRASFSTACYANDLEVGVKQCIDTIAEDLIWKNKQLHFNKRDQIESDILLSKFHSQLDENYNDYIMDIVKAKQK